MGQVWHTASVIVAWVSESSVALIKDTLFQNGMLAVLAAVVTYWFTKRRARIDGALKVLDQYWERYRALAGAYEVLRDPNALDKKHPQYVTNMDSLRAVGDWLDIVAMLYVKRHVSRKILDDIGLPKLVREYREYLRNYGGDAEKLLAQWRFSGCL